MRRISFGHNAAPPSAEKALLDVFRSGQYSPGPRVKDFEKAFAKLHRARHGIFVNSGTDALRLSLLAMKEKYGWADGDVVAVPALTFPATVNVVIQAGLTPLFVDVSMNDYCLNPWNLEHLFDCSPDHLRRLRGVIAVHLFGQLCGEALYDLCRRKQWKVLEDSCETILNPVRGDVSCHSTYMAHHVTTGVGGMALTNDGELNLLIRSYANHGRSAAYVPGYASLPLSKELLRKRFWFERIGYSCRGTEFEAVLGLSQLEGLEENVSRRLDIAEGLWRGLQGFDELVLPKETRGQRHMYMMFPVVLKEGSKMDKYEVCLHLEKNGVETRDMMPITPQPCYRAFFPEGFSGFSVAKWINQNGFYIPCHPGMNDRDVAHIARLFHEVLDKTVRMA